MRSESIYDPNGRFQKELQDIEDFMIEHGLCGYFELDEAPLWGYLPCGEDE